MSPHEEIPKLMQETALFWAAKLNPVGGKSGVAAIQPGGHELLDDLCVQSGLRLEIVGKYKDWAEFEDTLALYASNLRFRIFVIRESAMQAACNVVSTVLDVWRFRPRKNSTWEDFEVEFLEELQNPLSYQNPLRKCIRKHFDRPM